MSAMRSDSQVADSASQEHASRTACNYHGARSLLAMRLQLLALCARLGGVNVEGIRERAKRGAGIGEFIREQREQAQVSLRQLARLAGVSNPYLSQIERGLRKPSADILQQIAKALAISAEQLYIRAGILETRHGDPELVAAILADPGLAERQKQVLIDIYESFRRESAQGAARGDTEATATATSTAKIPQPAEQE